MATEIRALKSGKRWKCNRDQGLFQILRKNKSMRPIPRKAIWPSLVLMIARLSTQSGSVQPKPLIGPLPGGRDAESQNTKGLIFPLFFLASG